MEKHNLYFELIESFDIEVCPLCKLIEDAISRYYNNLLYEGVNDYEFIQNFRKNKGFCNYHTYEFLEYKNALSTAVIYFYLYKDIILDDNIKYIENFKNENCILCKFIEEIDDIYINSFISYLNDDEFKKKFLKSRGLCIPHYIDIKNNMKSCIPEWITDYCFRKWKEIYEKLKIYIDSKNYSLGDKRPLLTREEELIYQKAVKMLSGYKGKYKNKRR